MSNAIGGRVTIRDVAAAAGVSVTTVSDALNDKGKLRAETRARIQRIARELGYRPSRVAQAFRQGRTGTIALVLPNVGGPADELEMISLDFYMSVAAGAARAAFREGYAVTLTPRISTAEEWHLIGPDGVVLCDPLSADSRIDMLEEMGIPVVSIERDPARPGSPYYASGDNAQNIRDLLDHMHQAGARRIALLSAEATWAWVLDGEHAYRAWCAERGLPPLVVPVSLDRLEADSYRATCALLDGDEPPDGIIASAEQYSEGSTRACRERGIRIPDDLLLAVGMDSRFAQQCDPPITAIDLRPADQATAAVDLLLKRLSGEQVDGPAIVPSKLHIRGSTQRGPAPFSDTATDDGHSRRRDPADAWPMTPP
ncbi:LacI family DNA-binding transcriptional regulator [Microtetraspora niveoalba]|uniref:LacI family DNA-binding transcriptional regulator n=1 Tax=Microtetraspora niveoalba TaxID=46175 RepID=UPI0009FE25B5|nr:LacI family DNA-binding transcriptional regulator [Microtetraspora niveoalba]